jgi:competence CoiA-like predicted nuclease
MGRTFASDIVLMPDNKTVYMFDGKYSKNLYMFVSDKAEDFISGNLFVANFSNNSIKWEKLAAQNSLKLKLKLRRDLKFKSLYKSHKPKNDTCKKNYTLTESYYGKECLSVSRRSIKNVGVFEPIREAARLGVKPSFKEITSLSYDKESNMILLKKNGSVQTRFSANNKALDSEYIIK